MASIIKVGEKWRALIRRKGHPNHCRTFRTRSQAEAWARRVEGAIDAGAVPGPQLLIGRSFSLAEVINAYRQLREQARPIADTSNEHYMLKKLTANLGSRDALRLSAEDLSGYCRLRAEEGAGPYTCNMEVSKLGTVLRYAGIALKAQFPDVVGQARPLLNHLGLIGGGGKRERRPTEDELERVCEWLQTQKGALFADIVRFAVATAMRRGEIARLVWADVELENRMVWVRDRKDPRRKQGNDQKLPLLGEAQRIVEELHARRDADDPRVFPISESTVSKYFTEACRALAIPDLHFHDLRHEGTSRLFEQGYEIQQVALVTGHKDWRHLRRYTQLRPEDLHRA